MSLKLKKPLAFFDLEATGTHTSHDRIIEIAVIKQMPQGTRETWHKRINPGIPIPLEASLIHGIYDKDVKEAPPFKAIAKELAKFLQGCDLSGFNILRFDIPMLVESFTRANVDFSLENRQIVDTQRIFHLMEKRNLTAAYRFYCQQELEGAHSAMADTQAAIEVLEAQVARYEHQTVSDAKGNVLGTIENDMAQLSELTTSSTVDLAGRIALNEQQLPVFNFGKHKGKLVSEIFKKDPSYYDWIMKSDFPLDTKRKCTQLRLQARQ